jgi:hypothetical protein
MVLPDYDVVLGTMLPASALGGLSVSPFSASATVSPSSFSARTFAQRASTAPTANFASTLLAHFLLAFGAVVFHRGLALLFRHVSSTLLAH